MASVTAPQISAAALGAYIHAPPFLLRQKSCTLELCAAGWQRGGGRPACVVRAGSEDWRGEGCDAASHLVAEILALILVITGVSSRSLQLVVLI